MKPNEMGIDETMWSELDQASAKGKYESMQTKHEMRRRWACKINSDTSLIVLMSINDRCMFHAISVVNTPILEGPKIPEKSPLFQPLKQTIILIKCLYLCDTFSKFAISLLMLIAYQGRFIANSKLCTTLSVSLQSRLISLPPWAKGSHSTP